MSELSVGNAKLVHYLNEAYGTEMRLETALQAHISMTVSERYRKRLKDHLSETKRHARDVKQRIKRLGGNAHAVTTPGPDIVSDAAGALIGGAEKAVALAQGPLRAVRGTGEAERQLKNAKTEYASEAEEIATYTAIETLAEVLGDAETGQLARSIRREEERMLGFLQREINNQTKAVARAEIPSAERGTRRGRTPARKRRATSARKATTISRSRRSSPRAARGTGSSTAKARTRVRPTGSSRRAKPRSQARAKAGSKRAPVARAGAKR
jgi:ferritin-like metal-binding protein YciE